MAQSPRARLFRLLDGSGRVGLGHHLLNAGLVVLILISIGSLALETISSLPSEWLGFTRFVDWFTISVFTVEYIARVWCAVEDRRETFQHPLWGRLRYTVTPLAIVDLLAVLPFWLAFIIPVDLRVLRLFRIAWLIKMTRYSPAMASLASVVRSEARTLVSAMLLMLIVVVVASTLMYEVERDAQPDVFSSVPAALWWGIVTLTTVGYGDIVPITDVGRVLGAMFMFIGVGLFALPAAILAAGFAREIRRHDFVVSINRLLRVPILADLDAATLANLTGALVKRAVPARYAILRRGDPSDALYFIVEGQVEVDLPHGTFRLHEGEFFGERALLGSREPQHGTITSITDCQLLVLPAQDFTQLASDDPAFARKLTDLVDQHLNKEQSQKKTK